MNVPVIDKRNREKIYNQVLELAKQYVPEWAVSEEEEDVGVILSHIFSNMFADTIQRFNKMPYKNYIYFLNLLGADILPAISSRGYITVELTDTVKNGVKIKKGTHVYGLSEDGDRVLFELKDDMTAIYNKVEDIYCKSGNIIVKPEMFDENGERKSFKLFNFYEEENLQRNRLIFCNNDVLNVINLSEITLTIINNERPYVENKLAEILANGNKAFWEYLTSEGWMRIEEVRNVGNNINITIDKGIPQVEYNGVTSRWLSCNIVDDRDISEMAFTELRISSRSVSIVPESMYYNDLALTKENFLPFGDKFSSYDDFYINSTEVFTKKGAVVSLEFIMDLGKSEIEQEVNLVQNNKKWKPILSQKEVQEPKKKDINLERVIWEYWNGNGWARLFEENMYEDIFYISEKKAVKMNFICPEDIDYTYIGANYGLWIRARVLKIKNAFVPDGCYNYPIIEKISLSYSYRENKKGTEAIFIEKDMKTEFVKENKEIEICSKQSEDGPIAYMALSNMIESGPIKVYFQKEGKELEEVPMLRWEYWGKENGVSKWIELKLMDETNCLKKSGLITFVSKDNFEKLNLFGKEKYWIRLVNLDKKYIEKDVDLPCLKGIYFNTVKIVQQETMETEYFSIDIEQQNKICELIGKNIIQADVWVNEADSYIADDMYGKKFSDGNIIETDEQGKIIKYWVKWTEIEDIKQANAEDRVYMLEKNKGKVLFGDGKNGKIPNSSEEETIKIEYCIGMGEKGNFNINSIEGFADSVPFVNKVYNIEPIAGGCDAERVEEAVKRASKLVKHQNRIVSKEDYDKTI